MKYYIALITIVLFTISNCSKTEMYPNEFSAFGDLGYGTCLSTVPENQQTIYKINSASDFIDFKNKPALNDIDNWPEIDFNDSTLIAVLFKTPVVCSNILNQDLTWVNRDKEYVYSIDMSKAGYTAFGGFISWIVIGKHIPDDINISCTINYINP
ncbi:MAG: hypothetical protein CSA36_08575 [Draconibacterium sp.]|nr:MAG: hypothetical protein CSA36_08575 [Draconibacterium sp.]